MNKKSTQGNCTYMNGEFILDLHIPSRSIVTLINV